MIPKSQRRSPCPIACVLDVLGDRWTLLVIRDLVLGKRHFDEFLASPEGIATNILSTRLSTLTRLRLIRRSADPSDRRRAIYTITDTGLSLHKILEAAVEWGLAHFPGSFTMSGNERAIRRPSPSGDGSVISCPPLSSPPHRADA